MADTKTHEARPGQLEGRQEDREAARQNDERAEREDLNQGMGTGTHDTTRHGVDWGTSYSRTDEENATEKPTKKNSVANTKSGKRRGSSSKG